jgi:acylglycerol lipase
MNKLFLTTVPLALYLGCVHGDDAAKTTAEAASTTPSAAGGNVANPRLDHAEGTFEGSGGIHLFEQSWRPKGAARGVLVIMHGLKDYSGHYAWVAEALVERGYAVYAFDLRGHGRSEGDRVWVNAFDEYLNDLDIFVRRVREKEPGKPLFIFGHSMGGAIVTLYTLTRKPQIAGLLLSGPALKPGSDVSGFLIGVTKFLGSVFPSLGVLNLDNKSFSRDPAVVAGMDTDPLIYNKAGPARTASELLKAMEQIQEHMEEMTVPFIAMHGTADKLTNPEGSKDLYAKAKSTDKTLKLYDGFYHDLLHEPEKQTVFNDLAGWLDAHTAAAAGAPAASAR